MNTFKLDVVKYGCGKEKPYELTITRENDRFTIDKPGYTQFLSLSLTQAKELLYVLGLVIQDFEEAKE